jgi:hypothetical protein
MQRKMKTEWIEKYLTDAEQLITNNEVEQGLAILNSLLYEEPGYCQLHNYLGWAYLYYGSDTSRAELHFRMAIHFGPQYQAPYLHMASLCMRAHRFGEVLHFAELGLTKPHANKVALYELIGNVYEVRGELSKAIKAYKAGSISSLASYEVNTLTDGIKRCWKKRVTLLFTF